MALLAEQLVDEWLNRNGFFTLRGIRSGVEEIDLLGIRMRNGQLEGWHVEVQVSFRPISYIGKLSKEAQTSIGAKSATSAKRRSALVVETSMKEWVEKKFNSRKKIKMRDQCWPMINWHFKLVHAKVHEKAELDHVRTAGVEIISLKKVLQDLCAHKPGEIFGAAGTDIAELIRYFSEPED